MKSASRPLDGVMVYIFLGVSVTSSPVTGQRGVQLPEGETFFFLYSSRLYKWISPDILLMFFSCFFFLSLFALDRFLSIGRDQNLGFASQTRSLKSDV